MNIYSSRVRHFSDELSSINNKYNFISLLRLGSILLSFVTLYYYFQQNEIVWIFLTILFLVVFIVLMRIHTKLQFQRNIKQALLNINKDEIDFLESKVIPFENGVEFIDFHHPYAYDLDIFGSNSLFQYLNRTATFIGKKTLSKSLLQKSSNDEIEKNQEAIKELSQKIEFRQEFLALAKVTDDKESSYNSLLEWSVFNSDPLPKWTLFFSYVSPVLFLFVAGVYFVTSDVVVLKALSYLFLLNLMVLGKFFKRIQLEIANSETIDKIIGKYGLLLGKIENEKFVSVKLQNLQEGLKRKNEKASFYLKQLSDLFSRNDTIANVVTAVLFNGTFLFNFHVLRTLLTWKREHASDLKDWLAVIGEFEKLNSLANFSFNNPEFNYPSINTDFKIDFSNLSHPLLNPMSRVGNDVAFQPQSFMILTGSNMSGKSTFLRSLGINMVLAGTGSVVCAKQANVHPLPILVSMRLSDSLSDSESYFFAEIKRLKQIMDGLTIEPAFVLLDEILRGTNSDDKRNGTIEVLKKVIGKKAIGAIATHDIEVCLTTNDFPEILSNNCFEVEIVNNDLHFDYKLRNGICQNKSATFLMKKMEII